MIPWPNDLIEDIARRRCVLFLGAGISAGCINNSGRCPQTWKDFLLNIVDEIDGVGAKTHVRRLINRQDYLTACEVVKQRVGDQGFNSKMMDEFLTPQYNHSAIHEDVFKIDSRIVATPNFDKIYETYANGQAAGSIRVKYYYDSDVAEAVRSSHRIILKVHGTIDAPDKVIFTRKEYARARQNYRNFYLVLEALILTHTFIFLGCGVNDPDIKLLLEDYYFRYPTGRSHILVLPKKEEHKDIIKIIEESMNVKVLQYSKAHNHRELFDSIKNLSDQVEQKREALKQNGNW